MFFTWTSRFKFTEWKIWKIISILIILYTGLKHVYINGYRLKLEKSDNYTYQYNKKNNEYYVKLKEEDSKIKIIYSS